MKAKDQIASNHSSDNQELAVFEIVGYVKNAQKKPIQGISLKDRDQNNLVSSDENGMFSIKVSRGSIVTIFACDIIK